MKGEKVRIIIIYILIFVIVALVSYLIYTIMSSQPVKKEPVSEKEDQSNEISEKCTFDMTLAEYGEIINGNKSKICGGMNKINITDIMLNQQNLNVMIVYMNGKIDQTDRDTGIYIDGDLAARYAANNYINSMGIFDNKLFIYAHNDEELNVMAYNSAGSKVYDLAQTLSSARITDQVLADLAKNHEGLKIIVDPTNIDQNTVQFAANEFTFATNSGLDCTTGMYSGSIYKVAFTGEEFAAPQFINFVNCPAPQ